MLNSLDEIFQDIFASVNIEIEHLEFAEKSFALDKDATKLTGIWPNGDWFTLFMLPNSDLKILIVNNQGIIGMLSNRKIRFDVSTKSFIPVLNVTATKGDC